MKALVSHSGLGVLPRGGVRPGGDCRHREGFVRRRPAGRRGGSQQPRAHREDPHRRHRRRRSVPHRGSAAGNLRRCGSPWRAGAPSSEDGVELTGTFTATVNARLAVGPLTETVTVTGASPGRRCPQREARGDADRRGRADRCPRCAATTRCSCSCRASSPTSTTPSPARRRRRSRFTAGAPTRGG